MSVLDATDTIAITLGDLPATTAFGLSVKIDDAECIAIACAGGPGVFRARRRAEDALPPLDGALLAQGSLLGFLQRGPLLLPVSMPHAGWLLALAPEATRVEHGSPLFCILRVTEAITP